MQMEEDRAASISPTGGEPDHLAIHDDPPIFKELDVSDTTASPYDLSSLGVARKSSLDQESPLNCNYL